jgi:hypothetical protein
MATPLVTLEVGTASAVIQRNLPEPVAYQGENLIELDSYEASYQVVSEFGRGSDGRGLSRVAMRAGGSRVHSYPAERAVPDQDASFRANRLGVVGPIFGDGS